MKMSKKTWESIVRVRSVQLTVFSSLVVCISFRFRVPTAPCPPSRLPRLIDETGILQCPSVCASSSVALPVANWQPCACRNGSSQNCRFRRTYRHHERLGHCRLGSFLFVIFDWLRGAQEEEQEVLIDTVKAVAFSFSRATLCAMRDQHWQSSSTRSRRSDLTARRVARQENAVTFTCFVKKQFRGVMDKKVPRRKREVMEEKVAKHRFSEAKTKVLRSRKRNF